MSLSLIGSMIQYPDCELNRYIEWLIVHGDDVTKANHDYWKEDDYIFASKEYCWTKYFKWGDPHWYLGEGYRPWFLRFHYESHHHRVVIAQLYTFGGFYAW